MCLHCEHLVEDKEVVHNFVEVACKRLTAKLSHPIRPENIKVEVTVTLAPSTKRFIYRELNEMQR